MITKEEVNSAISAVKDAMRPGADFDWVSRSAIAKRAYFVGLYAGLRAIVGEDKLRKFGFQIYADTMFPLSGDDSFHSTLLGKAYTNLKKNLLGKENHKAGLEAIPGIVASLDEAQRKWCSAFEMAKHLMNKIEQIAPLMQEESGGFDVGNREEELRHELYRLLEELERSIRTVALIQTEHSKWKNILED